MHIFNVTGQYKLHVSAFAIGRGNKIHQSSNFKCPCTGHKYSYYL